MARFFFQLNENGQQTPDSVGSELEKLADAQRLAIEALCELIADQAGDGGKVCGGRIEIMDARGNAVLVVGANCIFTVTPPSDLPEPVHP